MDDDDYDALSRMIRVTTPDTAVVRTAYQGNRVMVGDQAGKKRMSETDAAGRLINVWEITSPNPGETQITFTGATSSDLTGLTMPTRRPINMTFSETCGSDAAAQCAFRLDSFSRLIRRNPEQAVTRHPGPDRSGDRQRQWSLAHFDSNGNLLRADPSSDQFFRRPEPLQ